MVDQRVENARIGYQAAVNLATNEISSSWNRYNAFLVANGIIIASIGWALASAIKDGFSILRKSQRMPRSVGGDEFVSIFWI